MEVQGGFSLMKMGRSRIEGMRDFQSSQMASQFFSPMSQMSQMSSMFSSSTSSYLDESSIVPGLGFGAESMPEPPSAEEVMEMMQMYNQAEGEQETQMNSLISDTLAKKEEVFQSYHYEFDDSGNPVTDTSTGKPKLYEGGEDDKGKAQRMKWERGIQQELGQQHREEFDEFADSANETMGNMNNSSSIFDYQTRKDNQQTIEGLQKQEQDMVLSHKQETLEALCGHLPDLDNPGQTLGDGITDGFTDFRQNRDNADTQIQNSSLGSRFQDYFEQVEEFISQQQEIWSSFSSDSFDPSAMSNYAQTMGMKIHRK